MEVFVRQNHPENSRKMDLNGGLFSMITRMNDEWSEHAKILCQQASCPTSFACALDILFPLGLQSVNSVAALLHRCLYIIHLHISMICQSKRTSHRIVLVYLTISNHYLSHSNPMYGKKNHLFFKNPTTVHWRCPLKTIGTRVRWPRSASLAPGPQDVWNFPSVHGYWKWVNSG